MMHTTCTRLFLDDWLKQLLNHLLGSLAGRIPPALLFQALEQTILRLGHNSNLLVEEKEKGGFYSSVPDFHDTPPAIPLSFKDISWYEKQLLHHFHAFLYHYQGITLYPSILYTVSIWSILIPYSILTSPVLSAEWLNSWLLWTLQSLPPWLFKSNCPGAHSRICKPSSMCF